VWAVRGSTNEACLKERGFAGGGGLPTGGGGVANVSVNGECRGRGGGALEVQPPGWWGGLGGGGVERLVGGGGGGEEVGGGGGGVRGGGELGVWGVAAGGGAGWGGGGARSEKVLHQRRLRWSKESRCWGDVVAPSRAGRFRAGWVGRVNVIKG